MPDAASGLVAVVKQAFNVSVRFVLTSGLPDDLSLDGVYVGRNVVYVSVDSTKPFSAVIGHGFVHYLRHAAPEVFDWFVQEATRMLSLACARGPVGVQGRDPRRSD